MASKDSIMSAYQWIHRYETERGLRLAVESDIQGLNKVLGDLSITRTDLEIQIKELSKDLDILKKEHQEVRKYSELSLGMIEWL